MPLADERHHAGHGDLVRSGGDCLQERKPNLSSTGVNAHLAVTHGIGAPYEIVTVGDSRD